MYRILKIKTKIKVPPTKFGLSAKKSILESLQEKYEGMLSRNLGVGLAVTEVEEIGEGKVLPEDANFHYPVVFDLLVFKPEIHEILVGEVIDNTEFGAFVRLGPIDGLVHVSQLLNDYVSFDDKNSMFSGEETEKTLKEGDAVRTKVISIAMQAAKENKIGLTMRQPGLGSLNWIEDEKKKAKKIAPTAAKGGGKKK
ncbi:DNA-directed RNA polymerase [Candidatus Micrarchaeota archaeon RBG_16_49_10]|nr:MAG: DNA-directed RNA polymerase [Candidatus Micrarchaeota archaeon RBG_16_49_10]